MAKLFSPPTSFDPVARVQSSRSLSVELVWRVSLASLHDSQAEAQDLFLFLRYVARVYRSQSERHYSLQALYCPHRLIWVFQGARLSDLCAWTQDLELDSVVTFLATWKRLDRRSSSLEVILGTQH